MCVCARHLEGFRKHQFVIWTSMADSNGNRRDMKHCSSSCQTLFIEFCNYWHILCIDGTHCFQSRMVNKMWNDMSMFPMMTCLPMMTYLRSLCSATTRGLAETRRASRNRWTWGRSVRNWVIEVVVAGLVSLTQVFWRFSHPLSSHGRQSQGKLEGREESLTICTSKAYLIHSSVHCPLGSSNPNVETVHSWLL